MCLVSIGIPVHNGERYLEQALESLLCQHHTRMEVIICDNASTDATEGISLDFARKDPRIRYHRNNVDMGAAANFNRALLLATGKLFMWGAHDDLWEPEYISTLIQLLDHESHVLAFSAFDNIDSAGAFVKAFPRIFDLPSDSLVVRLRSFIEQEESAGKANLIYGLMPREMVLCAGGLTRWGLGSWGLDMLVVFKLLTLGNLALSDRFLFHKRLSPEETLAISGDGRLRRPRGPFLARGGQRLGYLYGYVRLIAEARGLAFAEKRSLYLAVGRRAARMLACRLSS